MAFHFKDTDNLTIGEIGHINPLYNVDNCLQLLSIDRHQELMFQYVGYYNYCLDEFNYILYAWSLQAKMINSLKQDFTFTQLFNYEKHSKPIAQLFSHKNKKYSFKTHYLSSAKN